MDKPTSALFDVYLRLRPSINNAERFLNVEPVRDNCTPSHITIHPPVGDSRKRAVEKFAFTRVFEERAEQLELFNETGAIDMIEGVLGDRGREGRDGIIATLGVTGSGKSHTILGSRSQRGLTQLTLDTLFSQTAPYQAPIETSSTVFSSLCRADVSEAQLLLASNFLESLYCDAVGPSRATTPALVREPISPDSQTSDAFPISHSPSICKPAAKSGVFERLHPSLSKYMLQQPLGPSSSQTPNRSTTRLAHFKTSISKLTFIQESSFVSCAPTRRYMPRVSTLPTHPQVDNLDLNIDTTAEYAIIVSMYEVYNDRIFDLLTSSASNKTVIKRRPLLFKNTEHSPDRKVVAGLRKIVCTTLEDALLVLETGLHERKVAGTGSNAVSSRSHGFFCMEVKKRHRAQIPGPWSSSTLTIVDLAGSERARLARTAGQTLAEAGKINSSLMYLGQCMQMQSDNATSTNPSLVPFRQCKLTELLFSNSLAPSSHRHQPQKAIMIVTADPHGDFNSTSQILRYSALAREITVPRIPSVTSTILSGTTAVAAGKPGSSGRATPNAMQADLELAMETIATLRADLELAQLRLDEEIGRRRDAEDAWRASEERMEDFEAELRDEVWQEMEAQVQLEQRRWRAARDADLDLQDAHMDAKIEILSRGLSTIDIYEDKENEIPEKGTHAEDLFDEKALPPKQDGFDRLDTPTKQSSALRQKESRRTPSAKMRMLKAPRWQGSGMGVDTEY